MRRRNKVLLVLAGLLLLSQAPFVYRRYRLGRLRAAIDRVNAEHAHAPADGYSEYRGVAHVHSMLGGHSTGGFEELVRAAKENGLHFVVMTEHPSPYVNTAEATLKGFQQGVLFVNGSEIVAAGGERLLILPGIAPPREATHAEAQSLVEQAHADGRLAFVAYPERVRDWRLTGVDGVEIYNLFTNAKEINYALLFFDGLWSYWSYPELLFSTFYERPSGNLKLWDEINAQGAGRVVALAGSDAHSNVGLGLEQQTGKSVFRIKLDPYERSFRVVRNHVLLDKGQALDADSLLSALRQGHSFVSFDLFGDATGFRLTAESTAEKRIMGDEIALPSEGGVRLAVSVPVRSRVLFLRDGQAVHEERGVERVELMVEQKGAYRVEVYLDRLPAPADEKPWIISNPVYVR